MRRRAGRLSILALLLPFAASVSASERRIVVVVEAGDPVKTSVLAALTKTFPAASVPSIYEFHRAELVDPIRRGRLLATLQNSGLLVAVGDRATQLVLAELEDVPVYFVGGSLISGQRLESPLISGILSYNIDGLLDAAQRLWTGTLGLVYTPGYDRIAASIRTGAKSRGFAVEARKIISPREIPQAIRELLDRSQLIWIVGDPWLARGAGFQFLAERALSRSVPIVASGAWEVQHGAFLSIEPPPDALAAEAAAALKSIRDGSGPAESDRIRPSPAGGSIVYNGPLAERWSLQAPAGAPWRALR